MELRLCIPTEPAANLAARGDAVAVMPYLAANKEARIFAMTDARLVALQKRLTAHGEFLEDQQRQDKRFVALSGEDLSQLDFFGADLRRARFAGANLRSANLASCRLAEADFTGADLSNANCSECSGSHITFEKADLSEARLMRAHWHGANFAGAILQKADLTGCQLDRANLSGANLQGATLESAVFTSATLSGADLSETHAKKAIFAEARLQGCNFENSKLQFCNVKGAWVRGASFVGATGLFGPDHAEGLIEVREAEHACFGKAGDFADWKWLRFIGTLHLFSASYLAFLAIVIYATVMRWVNGHVDAVHCWAIEHASGNASEFASLAARMPKLPVLWYFGGLLVAIVLLTIATTLHAVFCPEAIKEATETRWTRELNQPLIEYRSAMYSRPVVRYVTCVCFVLGGTYTLGYMVWRAWSSIAFLLFTN